MTQRRKPLPKSEGRIRSIKFAQLDRLLRAYGMTREPFFSVDFEAFAMSNRFCKERSGITHLVTTLECLDGDRRERVIGQFTEIAERMVPRSERGLLLGR